MLTEQMLFFCPRGERRPKKAIQNNSYDFSASVPSVQYFFQANGLHISPSSPLHLILSNLKLLIYPTGPGLRANQEQSPGLLPT